MHRFVAATVAAAAALVLAAAGSAATVNVTIRSTGFSPGILTIDHGDRVSFRNADRADHQVVADDGSFASPILHANQTWTATLSTAGSFRFHDALRPSLAGRVTVKGPPPSVSLALSAPIAEYGSPLTLSGTVSNGAANQSVELTQQQWGQPSPTQLAIVKTGSGGTFAFVVTPSLYTTYIARWSNVASGSVVAQVAPKLRLLAGENGYMRAIVSSPTSLWRRHVFLQRLSPFGQWVNVAALMLGPQNGRIFRPAGYLPKGPSRIRVFLTVNQAGVGLLAAHSGTQAIVRTR
jgi:plastocyanin